MNRMIDGPEEYLAYVTRIGADHKRLRECLQVIEQQWTQQPSSPVATMPEILHGLQMLRTDLAHHFEEEECGGCMEEAVSHQASLSPDVARLEQEHPKLLGEVDRLIEWLSTHSKPGDSMDKIKPEFLKFSRQLHAHEAAENRILEKGFGIQID